MRSRSNTASGTTASAAFQKNLSHELLKVNVLVSYGDLTFMSIRSIYTRRASEPPSPNKLPKS